MKISRWIYFPLFMILSYVLPQLFFEASSGWLLYWLITGMIVGFGTLLYSDRKARQITGKTDDEEIYKIRQHRVVTVLLDYEKAFQLCREAAESLNPARIKIEDAASGVIQFRTRVNWNSWGHIITMNVKKLNQNLTEIEISTRPIPRTVIVGTGHSWKYVEELSDYLKEKDAAVNQKVLVESAQILEDVYVNPFRKEKEKVYLKHPKKRQDTDITDAAGKDGFF